MVRNVPDGMIRIKYIPKRKWYSTDKREEIRLFGKKFRLLGGKANSCLTLLIRKFIHASIIFKNGDSSRIVEFNSTEEHINFNSPFGNFSAPLDRVQRLNFKESHFESVEHFKSGTHPVVEPVEVLLQKAKGKIKLELNEIKNGFLHGRHPSMGDLKIPLEVIRKIEGGISLKKTEEF